jgi:hypothetical protein
MRACDKCGIDYTPTGKGGLCNPCRREYEKEWRLKRRLSGKPVVPTKMPKEYHRKYGKEYFSREGNRLRRNELAAKYSKDPILSTHHKARHLARQAIRRGDLVRMPCEVCGMVKSEAHHDDYSKPLDVRWLCRTHHTEWHLKAKAEGRS